MLFNVASRFIVAFLMSFSLIASSAEAFLFSNPLIDQPASDFMLYTLEGEKTTLATLRGDQKAILFFWATWCPYCRVAIKELSAQQDVLAKQGVTLLMVNVGEPKSTVAQYMAQAPLKGATNFLDTDGAISQQYLVQGLPTFVFINADGVVLDVGHQLPSQLDQIF